MTKHKGHDYKLSAVEYYLTEDNSQESVCRIFKSWVEKYNEEGVKSILLRLYLCKGFLLYFF